MTDPNHSEQDQQSAVRDQSWRERLFAGMTRKGIGLIAAICFLNGLRRSIRSFDEQTLFIWIRGTAATTLYGLIVALSVAVAVVVTYNLGPRKPSLRYAAVGVAMILTCIIATLYVSAIELGVGCTLEPDDAYCTLAEFISFYLVMLTRYGTLCAIFTVIYISLRTAEESAVIAQQAEQDRARFIQRMDEARLRMLQAQIEPHFLFNTLANVRRLFQTEPVDAARMLQNLMKYLAISLPQMRAAHSTLGREVELSVSYLNVQQIRMGHRLAFDFDIPEKLADVPLPPMMLLTLVENAIKHGLAPLPEGGHVQVSALASGGDLQVSVADTGRGFAQSSGGGTGLANIRARLAGMYGNGGRLTLMLNTPRGVTARIVVPLASPPQVAATT